MATHTYWRLNITLNGGDTSYLEISEIEMRATIGGADQCTGGTATANSEYSATYNAAKAFDDSTSTYWSTAVTVVTGWIRYQFAAPVDVLQYSIRSFTSSRAPRDWTLEYSDDGSSWTVEDTQSGQYFPANTTLSFTTAAGGATRTVVDLSKLISYSVAGGFEDKATLTKAIAYSVTGGFEDKATLTKAISYGVTGGFENQVTLTKLVAYAIIDDNLYRPQIFVIT